MARYDILPHQGIGPIEFGMKRRTLRQVLKKVPGAYPIKRVREADFVFNGAVHVHYSRRDDTVKYIQIADTRNSFVSLLKGEVVFTDVANEHQFLFEGVDVFSLPPKSLLKHIRKFDAVNQALSQKNDTYFFAKLILVVCEPTFEGMAHTGTPDRFTCVGLGNEDYLASMRRLNEKGFFDKEWSSNTKPTSRVRAIVKKFTSLGAEVAIDEEGEVRRVTFIAARLSRPLVDDDLADLANFEQLEVVFLGGNKQLTDAGLKYLQQLPKLKALNLTNTNLKNQVFALLKSWPELVELALPDGITSAGFTKLKNAKQLEKLHFEFEKEKEFDFSVLAQLPSLRSLRILGPLTDEHLTPISECPAIEELRLTFSKTTKKAIKRLCKMHPDMRVSVF